MINKKIKFFLVLFTLCLSLKPTKASTTETFANIFTHAEILYPQLAEGSYFRPGFDIGINPFLWYKAAPAILDLFLEPASGIKQILDRPFQAVGFATGVSLTGICIYCLCYVIKKHKTNKTRALHHLPFENKLVPFENKLENVEGVIDAALHYEQTNTQQTSIKFFTNEEVNITLLEIEKLFADALGEKIEPDEPEEDN